VSASFGSPNKKLDADFTHTVAQQNLVKEFENGNTVQWKFPGPSCIIRARTQKNWSISESG